MKLAVKKIDALRREIKFEVPKERFSQKLEEVFGELEKVAKVKGFRPGKAPRHVLEAEHGDFAREEVIKKLIPEAYQEGITQEGIIPLDYPEVQDVSFKDGILKFTAQVEIKPEIKISNYKGIPVKRKESKVTEDEINKTLDYFKKSHGQDKDIAIDDNFAKGLGFPNLETFKQSLVRQMEIDKDRQNRMDVENQVVEYLLKDAKFSVPPSFLKRQLEHRIEETKERFKSQGIPEAEIAKKEEELNKNLGPVVERDVKLYLILEHIADLEKVEVKENEHLVAKVMGLLMKEAKWEDAK